MLGSVAGTALSDPLKATPLPSSAPVGCSGVISHLPEYPPAPGSTIEDTAPDLTEVTTC